MLICPNCQNKEFHGALFCSECGARFLQHQPARTATNIYTSIPEGAPDYPVPTFPNPPLQYKNASVALHIMENDHMIFLDKNKEFSLGRATPGQPIVPDVDLNDFEAYEAGVSRLHASLSLASTTIQIQDLGSVNGTRLNGKKLNPYTAVPIKNGDILTLGKLKIQVLIREAR